MTLGNLLRSSTIQGNVYLSVWTRKYCGEEVEGFYFEDLEDSFRILQTAKDNKLLSKEVTYLFCAANYLHIEVAKEN